MASKKPPLKMMHEYLFELQDAAAAVTFAAARIYGAVQAHCDNLDLIQPGLSQVLRDVTGRHYKEMEEARNRLYRL